MHSKAHSWFAAGIASIIGLFFGIYLSFGFFNFILTIICGSIIGIISDIDLVLGIPHRRGTHDVPFIIIWSLIFCGVIYIISGYFQMYAGNNMFTKWDLRTSTWFPIPEFTTQTKYQLIAIVSCLILSGFTHIILDSITYMGLPDLFDNQFEGKIKANNLIANSGFIIIGFILLTIGISGFVFVVLFDAINSFWFLMFAFILFIIITITISMLIKRRDRFSPESFYEGNINGIDITLIGNECINVQGEDYCFHKRSKV